MTKARRRFGSVRKLPSGRYQARYRDQAGASHTAPITFASRGDAGRYLSGVETDLHRGEFRDPRLGKITFSEWVAYYQAHSDHKRATTKARDEHVLRTHFTPGLGPKGLASITPIDVREVVETMRKSLATATVRTNYGVLKAVMNAAVEADVLVKTPCRGITLPADVKKKRQTLTPAQLAELAKGLPELDRPLVYVAGVLGLRWSEVAGLRVRALDFLNRTLTLSETVAEVNGRLLLDEDVKTAASGRTMAVPPFVMDMLAAHLARRGLTAADAEALVFVAPKGGPLRATNFRTRRWADAVEALVKDSPELEGLTFHGLRHVAASLMVDSNEHPRVVQHRLGHATARLSMELYAHVSEAADKEAAAHLETLFSAASGTDVARPAAASL